MSDGAGEAVENAPAVATTDPPTTPVARVASTDAVVIGGTSGGGDDDPTPPAFSTEDLARMEEERVRVQELYLREADLKRREKAVAVAELSSPESLAAMNAERMRRAENFRLEALAKKATRGKDDAPPPPTAAAATSPVIPAETTWMERERLERRRRYELEAYERRRAAERAVTAEDVLRRKEAEASARRAMAEAMYAPSFVPPPSAVLGPNGSALGGNGDDDDAVETVTLEEVLHAATTTTAADAAADAAADDDAPGVVERGPETRFDEGDARGSDSGDATPDEGKGGGAADENDDDDADEIDAIADRLAAAADEDEAWDELDANGGVIAYGRIPWPNELDDISNHRLPASVERARLDRLASRFDPDEFLATYGDRVDEADGTRVMEKVREVSRAVQERRAALRRDS